MSKYSLSNHMQFDYFDDGEAVVYDMENEKIHILNVTAAYVVKLIIEKCDDLKTEYITTMRGKYPEISVTVLEQDYHALIANLCTERIITCNTADG